jgi:hypothetical protein
MYRWCGMLSASPLLPAIAIALAMIILKPMLRDSLFVDPR